MSTPPDLADFLATVEPNRRAALDRLRAVVHAANADLTESIKWNAPSFAHAGEHRVTLGLERKGGLRLVLHRGATAKPTEGFHFHDETGLARWPSVDRGVVSLAGGAEVAEKAEALTLLVRRWITATAS